MEASNRPVAEALHSRLESLGDSSLLEPISSDAPCGPFLEYDTDYALLRARLAPRGEVQYGDFVERPDGPDWADIKVHCRRLLTRTKDITLWVWMCRASARRGRPADLAQELATLWAALHRWPEFVHPQLEIEGALDPEVRANAIAALGDPEGLLADIRAMVLSAASAARLTVRDVERAFAVPRPQDAQRSDAVAMQLAALRTAGDSTLKSLEDAACAIRAIDAWCQAEFGADAPSLAALSQAVSPFLTERRGAPEPVSPVNRPSAQALPFLEDVDDVDDRSGAMAHLERREQVRRDIGRSREWFELHEPSSPVGLLLWQAERLVGKRFADVVHSVPPEWLQRWTEEASANVDQSTHSARIE